MFPVQVFFIFAILTLQCLREMYIFDVCAKINLALTNRTIVHLKPLNVITLDPRSTDIINVTINITKSPTKT